MTVYAHLLAVRALEISSQQFSSVQFTVVSSTHHGLFCLAEMFCPSTNATQLHMSCNYYQLYNESIAWNPPG